MRMIKPPGTLAVPHTANTLPALQIEYMHPAQLNIHASNTLIRPLPVHR
eukprot:CAMPEP_0172065174 /NCGR_PEP_ID=MMETSP1043-20130122/10497_1 /TAXON_ID=464988 /ORGANISM="Hemiselmis andersenii, Strain CCMP441" /LENGTH=48 /DNA_ID= /DNA_START= /DNA_END= /DNA_ORIENTATION=